MSTVTRIPAHLDRGTNPRYPGLLVNARVIRSALRAAGIDDLAARVTSGRHTCYVEVADTDLDTDDLLTWREARQRRADRIAAALRPLWADGAHRVSAHLGTRVWIERARSYFQPAMPDQPVVGAAPISDWAWATLVYAMREQNGNLHLAHLTPLNELLARGYGHQPVSDLLPIRHGRNHAETVTAAGRALVEAASC